MSHGNQTKTGLIVYTAPSLFTPLEEATLQFGTIAEIQQVVTRALMRRLAIPSKIWAGTDFNYSSANAGFDCHENQEPTT